MRKKLKILTWLNIIGYAICFIIYAYIGYMTESFLYSIIASCCGWVGFLLFVWLNENK